MALQQFKRTDRCCHVKSLSYPIRSLQLEYPVRSQGCTTPNRKFCPGGQPRITTVPAGKFAHPRYIRRVAIGLRSEAKLKLFKSAERDIHILTIPEYDTAKHLIEPAYGELCYTLSTRDSTAIKRYQVPRLFQAIIIDRR
jgi:hypothetical protein